MSCFCLLFPLYYLEIPPSIDIVGCDIAETFVVAPIVVVFDECFNRFLEFTRHLMRYEVNLSFDSAVISFYLAVGLRMVGCSCNVPYVQQPPVLVKQEVTQRKEQIKKQLDVATSLGCL